MESRLVGSRVKILFLKMGTMVVNQTREKGNRIPGMLVVSVLVSLGDKKP